MQFYLQINSVSKKIVCKIMLVHWQFNSSTSKSIFKSQHLPMSCYGDWYLPSIYELNLMRLNIGQQEEFAIAPYWSSTESGVSHAWLEDMQSGVQSISDKANSSALVRAIRAF